MKILVTGGCGFIGSNFIRYYLKENPKDKIINLDKLTYAGHISSTLDFAKNKNYKFVKGDICNSKLVGEVMKGLMLLFILQPKAMSTALFLALLLLLKQMS